MGARSDLNFPNESRVMAYPARVMRCLTNDCVRSRRAQKRGGDFEITSVEPGADANIADNRQLIRIAKTLDQLAKADEPFAAIGAAQHLALWRAWDEKPPNNAFVRRRLAAAELQENANAPSRQGAIAYHRTEAP